MRTLRLFLRRVEIAEPHGLFFSARRAGEQECGQDVDGEAPERHGMSMEESRGERSARQYHGHWRPHPPS